MMSFARGKEVGVKNCRYDKANGRGGSAVLGSPQVEQLPWQKAEAKRFLDNFTFRYILRFFCATLLS
ncbi:MAG: hypothetical protein KME32_36080 [Mojavia pulchra JT2-VF2]|uniref:Uncharacterized protein n=1 Tax=Mojavia pulchra JT2-VF2 TaxID=287848 RepID=A0A951Q600_9NOST|nr:hypothetical protein [Mojavia pulchra JT2-VF2]